MFDFKESRKMICKKCGNIQHIRPEGSPVMLYELYCVKCIEKFLDDNLGKMEEEK